MESFLSKIYNGVRRGDKFGDMVNIGLVKMKIKNSNYIFPNINILNSYIIVYFIVIVLIHIMINHSLNNLLVGLYFFGGKPVVNNS